MLGQVAFYLRHSINDLRVNGQRTFFALLCIAAGVAAIVSLQTLAVMISDTLTGNLQENNRGDIQFEAGNAVLLSQDIMERGVEDGVVDANTRTFFGQSATTYSVSTNGLDTVRAWLDENFPNEVAFTYRQSLTDIIGVFIGGAGTAVASASGVQVSQISPVIIDAAVYPFYGEVRSVDGKLLSELLKEPTDIVVSEQIAQNLGIGVGDTVRLNGADADFIVRGVVTPETEVKDPSSQDLFGALFGFYYLDFRSISLFEGVSPQTSLVYLRLADPSEVQAISDRLAERFPYLRIRTTDELRETYTDLTHNIDLLVAVMGLLSLLIGSIGIVNTMQVIVRRRTVEIAVLKTVGLQANQVTLLFMVESVIMGIIGSLLGIPLGWGATFIIKGAAEALLATKLPFVLALQPALNGLVVGTLVTTIFGFLPTLTAGQVRPVIVLRPADNIIPRAGRGRTLLALLVIIGVLTIIAQGIVGSVSTAFQIILGAFIAAGILYVLLSFLVWLVGKFFPSLGVVDLKIALRQMLAGRSRAAITLLALAVGVFALSLITLFADSIGKVLDYALNVATGGNVIITVSGEPQLQRVEEMLGGIAGVKHYSVNRSYNLQLVSLQESDTGAEVSLEEIGQRLERAGSGFNFGSNVNVNWVEILQSELGAIRALTPQELAESGGRTFAGGRQLTAGDAGQRLLVITESQRTRDAGINAGDKLTYTFSGGPRGISAGTEAADTITFEVVGVITQPGMNISTGTQTPAYALADAFPANHPPTNLSIVADIADEDVPELRRQLGTVPGTFALETAVINRLLSSLLGTFTAFPTMVAALGLVVGGVVIANSVALTTLERRREIAVMKAVGLQRERVLFMILLENAVLGLIGGLIGVGIGLVALVALVGAMGAPGSTLPVSTALILMALCIGVALLAAMTTAWGASGEKPLNVLRYE